MGTIMPILIGAGSAAIAREPRSARRPMIASATNRCKECMSKFLPRCAPFFQISDGVSPDHRNAIIEREATNIPYCRHEYHHVKFNGHRDEGIDGARRQ